MSKNSDLEWKDVMEDLHEDARSSRRFLMVAVPLGGGYVLAAQIWMRSEDPFWLLMSVIALASLIGYLTVHILRGFRKKASHRLDILSPIRRKWIGLLGDIVDNDVLFMGVTVGVPLLELMVLDIGGHVVQGGAMQWVQAAVCVLYLAYVALFMVVQGHRALMLILRAKEIELAHANEQVAMLRRDAAIAGKTHDGVTGTLSFIAFVAQKHMAENGAESEVVVCDKSSSMPDCASDWEAVNKAALDALDDVHAVIRLLGKPLLNDTEDDVTDAVVHDVADESKRDAAPSTGASTLTEGMMEGSLIEMITRACASGDSRLSRLGFRGSSAVRLDRFSACKKPDDMDEISTLTDLIGELYTNISKHADKRIPYYLTVSSERCNVVIVQSNGVAQHDGGEAVQRANEPRRPSGLQQGLSLHRKHIEDIGGTMNGAIEDGEWTLYIRIPC